MSDDAFSDPFESDDLSSAPAHEVDAFDETNDHDDDIASSSSTTAKATSPSAALADDPFASVDNTNTPGPSFDSFSNLEEKEEETPLALWESERKIVLAERQQKAEDVKAELLAKAKEDISKFYADQKSKLEKQQKVNRADEKNYKQDMKQLFETGNRWEKVNKLVNTQPKVAEKPGTSRVDRYRKLLIQLKTVKDKEEKKSL